MRSAAALKAQGFFWTMLIFAVIGMLLFFFTFKNVEEKVKIRRQKVTLKTSFSGLKGNKPWYIFMLNIVFMWGSYFLQQATLIYFFTYNIGRADLASVIATISAFVPVFGTLMTPLFARMMYKRTLFMVASAINLAGIIVMLIANVNVPGLIIGAVIAASGYGLRQAIYFSMQADPVDYGEWKTGINASGLMMALNGFMGKLTFAFAGALSGMLLTWGRYVPNQTQPDSALFAIQLGYLIIPAILVVFSMITMCFYNLDKIYPQIRAELDARSQKGETDDHQTAL